MKTQLLEDIGENSSIASLVPAGKTVNPAVQQPAVAPVPPPMTSHIERGVWRYKSAAHAEDVGRVSPAQPATIRQQHITSPAAPTYDPQSPATTPANLPEPSPPRQEPAPQDLQPAEVALAPVEPLPAERTEEPVAAIPTTEPEHTYAHDRSEGEVAKPLFDFSPPPEESTQHPEPFTQEPTWFERWGRRYAFVGVGLLAVVGLAAGGMWMIKERKEESALALIASEMKASPQIGKAATLQPTAAKVSAPTPEPTPKPEPEPAVAAPVAPVAVAPAPEAVKPPRYEVPKLVLLPPEPDTAPPKRAAPKRERTAERERIIPPPKRTRAVEEKPPVRQVARAPVVRTETKTESTSSESATVEACRAHGYSPAQCVKRACRVTKFGFVCPGK